MSNYAVDKGIEMDPKGRSGVLYPWRQMTPGDSFFVPLSGTEASSAFIPHFPKHSRKRSTVFDRENIGTLVDPYLLR